MTTSNIDLLNLAKYYHLPLYNVIQKDQLNKCQQINNTFYVINNQSSSVGSGSHWAALFLSKHVSIFFDSFGAPPSTEIVEYTKKFKTKHLYYNNFIIQDLHSDNCGYFAVSFALFLCQNCDKNFTDALNVFNEFVHIFDNDTRRNDKILCSIFRLYTSGKPPNCISKLYRQK